MQPAPATTNSVVAHPEAGDRAGRLPLRVCVGWGLGSLGMLMLLNAVNSLALKFAVDELGVGAALAGGLIAAARLFDAVIDPAMGALSDRTRHRWGRRRPYLLAGGIGCALSPALMFGGPATAGTVALVYIGAAMIFYAIAYTVFNTPYMAMPVEMTPDPHDRTRLMSFRIYGTAVGSLVGGAAAPALVAAYGGGREGYAVMGWALGAAVLAACLACFWMTRDAPVAVLAPREQRPQLTQLRAAFGNKSFVSLLLAKLFLVAGTGLFAAALAFFVINVMGSTLAMLGLFGSVTTVALIASQPSWVRATRRLGKKRCYNLSALAYALVSLSWLSTGPGEPSWVFVARAAALGLLGGGVLLASQAMLPDTLADDAERTGVRQEGVLTGIYTTIERGASALGVAATGLILGAAGYQAGQAEQGPEALLALRLCVAVGPALAMVLSVVAMRRYDLKG